MFSKEARILVCDDSKVSRDVIKNELTKFGFEKMLEVDSGEKAFDYITDAGDAEEPKVDLLVIDLVMPGLDGLETTRRIKAMGGAFTDLPIIILTADSDKSKVVQAIALGVSGYIIKPFESGAIVDKMKSISRKAKE